MLMVDRKWDSWAHKRNKQACDWLEEALRGPHVRLGWWGGKSWVARLVCTGGEGNGPLLGAGVRRRADARVEGGAAGLLAH